MRDVLPTDDALDRESGRQPLMGKTVLDVFPASDTGRARAENEDRFAVANIPGMELPMLVVADGLGGHNAGATASQMIVDLLPQSVTAAGGANPVEDLCRGVQAVNVHVLRESRSNPALIGMGSTLAVVIVVDQYMIALNVGDSRIYLLSNGVLTQISEDHTLEKKSPELAHVLTRAIGVEERAVPAVSVLRVAAGDRFLLCSDGLTDEVSDEEIAEILGSHSPRDAARQFIKTANARGGHDNITVIVSHVESVREGETNLIELVRSASECSRSD